MRGWRCLKRGIIKFQITGQKCPIKTRSNGSMSIMKRIGEMIGIYEVFLGRDDFTKNIGA